MRKQIVTIGWVGALLLTAGAAQGAIITYNFSLDGLQEVPPVATPATGSATVVLNDVTGAVTVSGTYTDLIGTVTASHIHAPAAPGVNAGVILALTVAPPGGTSGTITGAGTLSPANVANMLAGLTYINVHSSFRPGGEIRGQVLPEPASLVMLGLLALPMLRRRREV